MDQVPPIPGLQRMIRSKKGSVYVKFWTVTTIIFTTICFYQIVTRVEYYISDPVNTVFLIKRLINVKFPSFTICGYPEVYPTLYFTKKAALAKHNATEQQVCETSFLDALKGRSFNVNKIWNAMNIDNYISYTAYKGIGTFFTNEFEIRNNFTATEYGICKTYRPDQFVPFKGEETAIMISVQELFWFSNCNHYPKLFIYTHEENDTVRFPHLFWRKDIQTGHSVTVAMSQKRITHLNRSSFLCDSGDIVTKCWDECLYRKLKKIAVCWLPYIEEDNEVKCSVEEIQETLSATAKLSREINPVRECGCRPKCSETLYQLTVNINGKMDFTVIKIHFHDNTIQTITEIPGYTFIALLCDIGGNLGLYLGISIMTLMELFDMLIRFTEERIQTFLR